LVLVVVDEDDPSQLVILVAPDAVGERGIDDALGRVLTHPRLLSPRPSPPRSRVDRGRVIAHGPPM
jgi:hypothetical protein